jgi:hypothetical protein
VLTDRHTQQDLFDIAIEGLAYIWLKMPVLLKEMLEGDSLFQTLVQTMLKDKKTKGLYLQTNTKAQILRTLTRYLQMQESTPDQTKLIM